MLREAFSASFSAFSDSAFSLVLRFFSAVVLVSNFTSLLVRKVCKPLLGTIVNDSPVPVTIPTIFPPSLYTGAPATSPLLESADMANVPDAAFAAGFTKVPSVSEISALLLFKAESFILYLVPSALFTSASSSKTAGVEGLVFSKEIRPNPFLAELSFTANTSPSVLVTRILKCFSTSSSFFKSIPAVL